MVTMKRNKRFIVIISSATGHPLLNIASTIVFRNAELKTTYIQSIVCPIPMLWLPCQYVVSTLEPFCIFITLELHMRRYIILCLFYSEVGRYLRLPLATNLADFSCFIHICQTSHACSSVSGIVTWVLQAMLDSSKISFRSQTTGEY